ncbi:MAG TPA: PIG-L family deacetylase [Gaiellaceae bacterium]|nr:PIG-L family deacetylase [Gaiellaceae bacterium]
MQVTKAKAAGALRWLGLLGRRAQLEGEVVVVSPHMDDAVLSLGAAISRAARSGARVTILTVLAGDPSSKATAGEWDRACGFGTAGEAATARRAEDAAACAHLGATSVWLPYSDHQYERGGADDEIRAAVVEAVGSSLPLLPGYPLGHEDHRWLHEVLEPGFEPGRRGFYLEQPYAAMHGAEPPDGGWRPLGATLGDQRRKLSACRAYASQQEPLGRPLASIFRYEIVRGGEWAVLP